MPALIFSRWIMGVWLGMLMLTVFSCQRRSDFFFVRNQGAVMPVKVSGNAKSGTFLMLLPGGPAGDGLIYQKVFPFFKQELEKQYAVVYYDQRGAGNCQGTYDTTTLNLAQLSEDLTQVINAIQSEYADPKIFLLAYSYGGALGITHLLDAENSAKIAGMISIAGAFDRKKQMSQQEKLIEYCLQRWQTEGQIDNIEKLQNGFTCQDQINEEQCREDSIALREKILVLFDQVENYNQFKFSGKAALRLLDFALFSQSNPIFSGTNEALHAGYYQPEFNSLQLSDRAAAISTPMLLINGRWDTNVPFFAAQDMYHQLGTNKRKKHLLFLEKSGHLPMITEPVELSRAIIQFVEQTNNPTN